MAGRFPLFTDENIEGALVEALSKRGWDIVRAVDVFDPGTADDVLFAYASRQGRVFVTTDDDFDAIGSDWLKGSKTFRMVRWSQRQQKEMTVGDFVAAFEGLARKPDSFGYPIEYLKRG